MKKCKPCPVLVTTMMITLLCVAVLGTNCIAFPANLQIAMEKNNVIAEKNVASSNSKSAKNVIFEIIGENGEPLRGASIDVFNINGAKTTFYLKEMLTNKDGKMTASIDLPSLPSETQIGILSEDNFYCYYAKITDLIVSNGTVRMTVPKSGIILATLKKYPTRIKKPVVAEIFKKNNGGRYESYKGIGFFLSEGKLEVECLPAGIYKIQIKNSYDSSTFLFEKENIKVTSGIKTDLDGIDLTDDLR